MVEDARVRSGGGWPRGDEPSDHTLLHRFKDGSEDAANALYHRYAHRLRALARAKSFPDLAGRLDHSDIVQSVFRSFFRGVNGGAYDVPAGEELWNLFLVMTLNKIRANGVFHRAAKRDVRMTTADEAIDRYADASQSDENAYALLKMAVEEALDRLPEQHKLVVELRMQGHEVAEIAQTTGRSKRSVERVLQESRERLGALLVER
jgi:RNA polymerase sigma factor (sigma-70 family)